MQFIEQLIYYDNKHRNIIYFIISIFLPIPLVSPVLKYSIYKVVCSVCLSDHNLGKSRPNCLKFCLGNSGETQKSSQLGFEIQSSVGRLSK